MALSTIEAGGVVALGYDTSTGERGFLCKHTNGTGTTSVKGSVVSISTTDDNKFVLQANEYDAIGVVAESGIANNGECWVWKNGSRCQVLVKDTIAVTRGGIMIAADTDGRADWLTSPGIGLPAAEIHFKEIGHPAESKSAGTNVLVLTDIHFN